MPGKHQPSAFSTKKFVRKSIYQAYGYHSGILLFTAGAALLLPTLVSFIVSLLPSHSMSLSQGRATRITLRILGGGRAVVEAQEQTSIH